MPYTDADEAAWRAEMRQLEDELETEDADDASDEPEEVEPDETEEESPKSEADTSQAPAADDGEKPAEPDSEGEDDAQAEPDDEGPPTPEQPAPAEAAERRPFRFRVHGQDVEVPGAIEADTPEGRYVAMPVEQFNRVILPRASVSQNAEREITRLRSEVAELKEARTLKEQQADTVLSVLDELEKAKSEDDLYAWAVEYRQRLPTLKTQAERDFWKQQAERTREQAGTRDEAALEQDRQQTLAAHIERTLADPEVKPLGLDPQVVFRRLWRVKKALYTTADRDYPEYGVRKGDEIIDPDVFYGELNDLAGLARQRTTAAKRVEEAKQKNDAALGKGKNKARPAAAVPAKGSPAPAGPATPEPKSLDEWRASLVR